MTDGYVRHVVHQLNSLKEKQAKKLPKVTIQNKAGEEIQARDLALIPGPGATDETRERLKIMADVVESLMKKKG